MLEKKNTAVLLSDDQLDDVNAGTLSGCNCGVSEGQFPSAGKCHSKTHSVLGVQYEKVCKYCGIQSLLPTGESLEVTYIFECSLYGYDRRVKG